jgi:hypothetical protein
MPDAGGRELTGMAGRMRTGDRIHDPRPGPAGGTSLPGGQGQLEVLQGLISDLIIERAHGDQCLHHPQHPGPVLAAGCARRHLLQVAARN